MSEKYQAQWKILEETALRQLSNPDLLIADKTADLFLRLWQYPSFERHKIWAVYAQANDKDFLVQRAIWNRQNDYKKLFAPVGELQQELCVTPGISTKVKTLKSEIFKPYFEELQTMNIAPLSNKNDAKIDTIRFGLEFKKNMADASFSWWCSAPSEWQLLEIWFLKTKNFLDLQFANLS